MHILAFGKLFLSPLLSSFLPSFKWNSIGPKPNLHLIVYFIKMFLMYKFREITHYNSQYTHICLLTIYETIINNKMS